MSDTTFDYIIIGAGTAGSLLANRLSADRQLRVLLLEAGRKDDYHWVHIPGGALHCQGNPRTDWCDHTEPEAGLQDRRLPYPRGKVLGGTSSIHGMLYLRGQARDYDLWAQLTDDPTWSWDQVLPAFKRHESHWRLDPEQQPDTATRAYHGDRGEWRVERQRLRWDILDAFAQAAQQAGIPATDDFNQGCNEGVGYFEVNQKDGWRWNAAKAFLRPTCYARPNFELWTLAQATQLLTTRQPDGRLRCTGVRVWTGEGMEEVHATEEVLLCAGAIASPQLLQLSGIGPAQMLYTQGITPVHDLPGVGANLQDHLQLRSIYRVTSTPTLNTLSASWWGQAHMGLAYALRRSGPMSMAPAPLGAFARSRPDLPHPNLQWQVQPLSCDAEGAPLHRFAAFTASVCNLHPTSRGTVRLKSPRFADPPAIAPQYLSTAADRQVAVDSLRLTQRIVAQPALAPFAPQAWLPSAHATTHADDTDAALVELASRQGAPLCHPVGTTKMGHSDDPLAVLDSRLRVRGIDGLRVVDAGAMPTLPSGGTASPTLMLAEKAAGWIRADLQARRQPAVARTTTVPTACATEVSTAPT